MKKGLAGLMAAVVLFLAPSILGGDRKPIVAVFDVEVKRIKLSKSLLDGLSDYLATKLAGTGKYQVIPRDQLKKRLLEQKKKSFKQCYDQKCQIEMGRELAAEKTLSAQVIKFGKFCTVNVALYDLKKAATESAASVKGRCGEEGLIESLDKAISKLVGIDISPTLTTKPELEKTTGKGPAGIEWVVSKPAGLEFTKSEITVAQYRACVEAGKCTKPKTKSDSKYCNWGYSGRDNHPINCMDWNQATAFCEWAGGRLPTEDEWYSEASDGGKREFPWGNQTVTCDYAVMPHGGNGCGRESTWPVCSKERGNSVSGLCDMSGNVWEWTSSLYKSGSSDRVGRGGCWDLDAPESLRASYRNWSGPASRGRGNGFRCGR